ncbi:hypothetical protein LPJ77_003267 [Coemansia sp. RSA 2523]|nr:hypothetical protein LPJ58_002042 [Coemansia sp. RSA 1591]KAJ1764218.1 hypothetical protein LPJ69_001980 [Coemansia sp. RSA 1752]KAJ1776787.1 hypothetical protein LPJ54_002842 [Coemansia sp. RSA 1824]KAJ1791086.1 hypothetical protein LPJ67_001957 [Coemansia sp. RSA 1938]KAJ1807029.1 hypothetical protein LPJ77_003267 [Coemansia sp. RSA 2523]KAJ2114228.1 hypothetical protein GGH17_006277 [Coemansia sp. RSA 788]KAJ2160330.1 hypothetical protein GGH16_005207 [Coemansia sp. RSA 560]KAJ2179524.
MADSLEQPKRRRLLSRRELRHQGTRIVRVGSSNVLQTSRGQYNFAAKRDASSQDSTPVEPVHEPIDASSSTDDKAVVQIDDDDDIASSAATPKIQARRMYKISQMSERAQRLRVSPSQRRKSKPLFQIEGLLQSSDLPPPLNLDQTILSFPEPSHRPSDRPSHRSSDRPSHRSSDRSSDRARTKHLTPLRKIPEKLRLTKSSRPVFGFD